MKTKELSNNQIEMQRKLDETFPVVMCGTYERQFDVNRICYPLNWGYELHKPVEKINWEYRANSMRRPMFLYREEYSYTIIQATFIMCQANRERLDISATYLDQEQLLFNQEHMNSPEFIEDYLVISPKVDDGEMFHDLYKIDRKLSLAFSQLKQIEEENLRIKKIPIEKMFNHAQKYLAIPFINESLCSKKQIPSENEILKYASGIWEKIEY
jgi:hypothetical protein